MRYTVEVTKDSTSWYKEGTTIRHRLDGPAIEYANGTKYWYNEGKLHREDGPACEYADGDKEWYKEDKRHREDGPAIEYANGDKEWYNEGKLHREDGPAVEYANGDKYWYKEGKCYTEKDFNEKMNPSPTCEGKVVEIDGKKYKLSLV